MTATDPQKGAAKTGWGRDVERGAAWGLRAKKAKQHGGEFKTPRTLRCVRCSKVLAPMPDLGSFHFGAATASTACPSDGCVVRAQG